MNTDTFEVIGGSSLSGILKPQGAKNEALQTICCTLLTSEKVILSNIPEIIDVNRLIDLLRGFGVKIKKLAPGTFEFQADAIDLEFLHSDDFRENATRIRGSVMLLGPLLARFQKAFLPQPGGDKIGRPRLDTHFNAFEKLGCTLNYDSERGAYEISAIQLTGAYILMDEISVTGTANIVMAAVMADGTTTIYNAACEPYLQQLCRLLIKMGANIKGVGSNMLIITGVDSLYGVEHKTLPDMIEIGSFIGLAAITQSDITIKDAAVHELGVIIPTFRKLGIEINIIGDDIHIPAQKQYEIQSFIDGSILTIYYSPWPGFTPDLMSICSCHSGKR